MTFGVISAVCYEKVAKKIVRSDSGRSEAFAKGWMGKMVNNEEKESFRLCTPTSSHTGHMLWTWCNGVAAQPINIHKRHWKDLKPEASALESFRRWLSNDQSFTKDPGNGTFTYTSKCCSDSLTKSGGGGVLMSDTLNVIVPAPTDHAPFGAGPRNFEQPLLEVQSVVDGKIGFSEEFFQVVFLSWISLIF